MNKNRIYFLLAAIITVGSISMNAFASGGTSDSIKSRGLLVFDNDTPDTSDDVIFDASDLTMLETEIDAATEAAVQGKNDLVDMLKEKLPSSVTDGLGDNPSYDDIAEAIGNIGKGANFTASDLLMGKIGYDGSNLVTGTMPNKGAFTSTGLKAGESLIIPEGYHNGSGYVEAASLASQTGVTGTYTNTHDTEDTSDDTEEDLVAATADNLSLGTAAWVDGQYIVGNGADNNSYYATGYASGKSEASVERILVGSHQGAISTTSCSFDCTSIQGWENLTSDNFSFMPTGGFMNYKSSNEYQVQNNSGGNVSILYDNSTGVVTVSGLEIRSSLYTDVFAGIWLSGNVYCYVMSD